MRRPFRHNNQASAVISAGWLFADMLLVLTMLFLALTAVGKVEANPIICASPSTSTPSDSLIAQCTPTPTSPPTPSPTQVLPCLERNFISLDFSVDDVGLLANKQSAINDVQNKVQISQLEGRRAGIVIIFVGAGSDSSNDVQYSNQVAYKIQAVLEALGSQGIIFDGAVYHPPLLILGAPFSTVHIEIYLFALPGQCR